MASEPYVGKQTSAQKLIGKCSVRNRPMNDGGVVDRSYTSTPIIIHDVSQHGHIFYVSPCSEDNMSILSTAWNDDEWVEVPEFMCLKFRERYNSMLKNMNP